MAIKDILVLLDANSDAAGSYAVSLASAFQAHLTAVALVVNPTAGMAFPNVPMDFLISALENARNAARRIPETLAAKAQASGVTFETDIVETTVAGTDQAIGSIARHVDLTIIEQPNPDSPGERESLIEATLFGSGRPVLVVPYIQTPPLLLEKITIAWDGSATAARAVGDAIPFLARAGEVELVTVADPSETDEETEAAAHKIMRHLARHDIETKFRTLPRAGDVAGTLLSYAFDSGTDLMVMGGYGHSRFREVILGGATRGMIESMTVPVLMSH
jgi:nucleotide-binding universal stress UspA family protein